MGKIINTIEDTMINNAGEIFAINDFYDIGNKNTVKSILYRLNEEGKIVRLIDGLYTKPKYSEILDEYSYPTVNEVAEKIADKFSWTISPTAETALNYTGLSTQIPNEYIYISDGAYREYIYRGKKIIFKHTTNRNITSYSRELSILIQSIKAIGKNNIDDDIIYKLSKFAKNIKEDLIKDTRKLPTWIKEVLSKIKEMNSNE